MQLFKRHQLQPPPTRQSSKWVVCVCVRFRVHSLDCVRPQHCIYVWSSISICNQWILIFFHRFQTQLKPFRCHLLLLLFIIFCDFGMRVPFACALCNGSNCLNSKCLASWSGASLIAISNLHSLRRFLHENADHFLSFDCSAFFFVGSSNEDKNEGEKNERMQN